MADTLHVDVCLLPASPPPQANSFLGLVDIVLKFVATLCVKKLTKLTQKMRNVRIAKKARPRFIFHFIVELRKEAHFSFSLPNPIHIWQDTCMRLT